MTTIEIISAFLKGNTFAKMSPKQYNWLIGQAKKEGTPMSPDSNNLYFEGCHYSIKAMYATVAAYGGGLGKRATGYFKLEKMYHIRFKSTGLTYVGRDTDLKHFTETGHEFEIISFEGYKNDSIYNIENKSK